jgi:hypothetical protein
MLWVVQPEWLDRAATRCFIVRVQPEETSYFSSKAESATSCAFGTRPCWTGHPAATLPILMRNRWRIIRSGLELPSFRQVAYHGSAT